MSKRYALIIGNSHYDDDTLPNLTTPASDADDLAAVLQSTEIGGFDEVQVLHDATLTEMRVAVGELFGRKHKPDDMLLFYFSGHGELDTDDNLYLVGRDTRRGPLLRATGLEASFVAGYMNSARSRRQVIILDSCYSGAFGSGAKGGRVGTKNIFEGSGYGRYVLTASDALQLSWEGDRIIEGEITNSFFTHFLVDGLRSGAADRNGDGYVDLDELYDHIHEGMMRASGKQQPLKFTFSEKGDLLVARSPMLADDRERAHLTKLLSDAEVAADQGDYYQAEKLLVEVMNTDSDGVIAGVAQSLLDKILVGRTRSSAYADVKRLLNESSWAAKALWSVFKVRYPGYDPDAVATRLAEISTRSRQKIADILPAPFEWINIPGNRGSMKTHQGHVTLSIPEKRYLIAKYVITNAQFAKFAEAGGYRERRWWTEAGWEWRNKEGWTEPRFWKDSKWNRPEHPVVGIAWYEAVAFCLWISEATGQQIMLPTEAQWQYAAQGPDGYDYPWGSNWDASRCQNSVGARTDTTALVTQYEGEGDSIFGMVNAVGNVWEWCLSDYDNQQTDIYDVADRRVLRGGSWLESNGNSFRCDFRGKGYPYDGLAYIGFRIALS